MKIMDFKKTKTKKHLSEVSNGEFELQKQYQEDAQFYDRWYNERVVGQDENGEWIYKHL